MENIDFEKLRKDLIDYFGSATPIYMVAFADVIRVENASNSELVQIAYECGFDLDDYIIYRYEKKY